MPCVVLMYSLGTLQVAVASQCTVLLTSIISCIHQMANVIFMVAAFVSFMQPVQVKQQVESAIRTMCSEYSTAESAGRKAT